MPKNEKRRKKTQKQKAKEKADTTFSLWFKTVHADSRGYLTCYTCGTRRHIEERMGNGVPYMQTGHFNKRGKNATRYDPENCRVQCWSCNCGLDGNYIVFTEKMIAELGEEKYWKLRRKSEERKQWTLKELLELITYYQEKLNQLDNG